MKYVIFTKVDGYVFYMCWAELKGPFVSASAPDSQIMKFDSKEKAEEIAERNSSVNRTYKVKEINLG